MVLYFAGYDESILLYKLTPDKVKQKVANFKVRDKLAYIQERILKAKEDFEWMKFLIN